MATPPKPVNLTLQIGAGKDADSEELDLLTRQLFDEIQDLDVQAVTLVRGGAPPEGAKSADLVTLGSLAVAVLPVTVPKLVELLQSWANRGENRTVKIKAQVDNRSIEVEYSPSAMTTDELKKVVSAVADAMPKPAPGETPKAGETA